MTLNRTKFLAASILIIPTLLISVFHSDPVVTFAAVVQTDTAAVYKTKCAMCHSPKAEKLYDPAKKDEEHIEVILKGKKGEKPPYMPGFEAKGMKPEEAKALAEYMRSLRTP